MDGRTPKSKTKVLKKFSYLYDPMGNRTSSQANNTVTGYTNNAANQTTATSGSGKLHVAGTLNEPSKVTVNGVPAGGHDSKYEAFVPVTPGTNTLTIQAEDYSPNANTASKSWSVEVTGGTARSFTYDTNGNTLNDGIRQYEWDAENRLTKITKGTDVWEFSYDGASHRILEKKNGSITRRWTWLGTRIAQELNAAGDTVLKNYYSHGEQRIGGTDAGLYYYTRDHLGSLREMTDSSGAVRVRNDYDPYGVVTKMEGDLDCQWAFTGHYFDPAIGLHFTLFRAYDQATGKWLSPDPIREEGGQNIFGYCRNNTTKYTDPIGLSDLSFISKFEESHLYMYGLYIPKDNEEYFTVFGHGSFYSMGDQTEGVSSRKSITPEELAMKIRNHPNWKPGKRIFLFSCSTGGKANGFAQELANIMNTQVVAPTTDIRISGSKFIKDNVVTTMGYNGLYPSDEGTPGKWGVFQPHKTAREFLGEIPLPTSVDLSKFKIQAK